MTLRRRRKPWRTATCGSWAKKWLDTVVGRPVVQAFAGSLEGHRARKGVMITTSAFSQEAKDYVQRIEKKIVLIDGKQLARLMIEHDVGVTVAKAYTLKKLDQPPLVKVTGPRRPTGRIDPVAQPG